MRDHKVLYSPSFPVWYPFGAILVMSEDSVKLRADGVSKILAAFEMAEGVSTKGEMLKIPLSITATLVGRNVTESSLTMSRT